MYQINKNGITLGLTERPTYIKPLDNGSMGLCSASEAHGIAYEGEIYHLSGMPELGDAETVVLAEIDAGKLAGADQKQIAANTAAIDDIIVSMLEG